MGDNGIWDGGDGRIECLCVFFGGGIAILIGSTRRRVDY